MNCLIEKFADHKINTKISNLQTIPPQFPMVSHPAAVKNHRPIDYASSQAVCPQSQD